MLVYCEYCKSPFDKRPSDIKKHPRSFCSRQHFFLYKAENAKKNKCKQCGKSTSNPKFCSASCAATYNNRLKPKRKPKTSFCQTCGKVTSARRKYGSRQCNPSTKITDSTTMGELKASYENIWQFHATIRGHSRSIYSGPRKCAICGYDKHVEVCHIRRISSFDDSQRVVDCNNSTNLVALCPNCHWELDHHLLILK